VRITIKKRANLNSCEQRQNGNMEGKNEKQNTKESANKKK
jgi:hypothetical protein